MVPVQQESANASIGSIFLIMGGAGLILMAVASLEGLPLAWQRFILGNGPGWCLASLALMFFGTRQLWLASHETPFWQPTRSGRRFETLIVYSRVHCPLCEEAVETLTRYRRWLPEVIEVNIDEDPALVSRFGESVPIVELDGRIRFRGDVNEVLLRRLIEGTPPNRKTR